MDSFNTCYTLPPVYDNTGESYYRPQIRTEFDANYVQVRGASSRGRHNPFTLYWDMLPENEYQDIKSFFDAHNGIAFEWTHDITGNTHTVVFAEDSLDSKFVKPFGYRSITIKLEEM